MVRNNETVFHSLFTRHETRHHLLKTKLSPLFCFSLPKSLFLRIRKKEKKEKVKSFASALMGKLLPLFFLGGAIASAYAANPFVDRMHPSSVGLNGM